MEGNKVMPIDLSFIIILFGWSRISYKISKSQKRVEIFAIEITNLEKESVRPRPSELDPLMVVDLPRLIYTAILGSSLYICNSSNSKTVDVFDIDLNAKTDVNYPTAKSHS